MTGVLDDSALDTLFRTARSRNGWSDKPVTDDQIHQIYDLMKWGPTAVNSTPARIVWIKSQEAKARLEPHLSGNNKVKTMTAPVTAIIGTDMDFAAQLPKLFPHAPGAKDWFPQGPARDSTAFRNSTLQGAYLIIAARAIGLDAGPMSGFNNDAVDAEFFAGTNIKSNFIVALGYGTEDGMFDRLPRLSFDEANTVI